MHRHEGSDRRTDAKRDHNRCRSAASQKSTRVGGRAEEDLHTHLLSSSSTRWPRHVQLTLPCGVSRQRSPQPPFMRRQGDSSPLDDSRAQVVSGDDTVESAVHCDSSHNVR